MKYEFEVDTAHTARTLIALGAFGAIATVSASAYDRFIAIVATLLISATFIVAIKEQKAQSKSSSRRN